MSSGGSTPVQSLTSLEWYREALNESAGGRRASIVRWFRGLAFLRFHFSLYVFAIVALFALNLARSPESLWIDNVALAWVALLVVHAACAGLIWAVGLLRESDREEVTARAWTQARPPAPRIEPQEAEFRMAATVGGAEAPSPLHAESPSWQVPPPADTPPPAPSTPTPSMTTPEPAGSPTEPAPRPSPWGGWEPTSPAEIARQAEEQGERASWKQAAAAAWLAQESDVDDPGTDPFGDARGTQRPRPQTPADNARQTDTATSDGAIP